MENHLGNRLLKILSEYLLNFNFGHFLIVRMQVVHGFFDEAAKFLCYRLSGSVGATATAWSNATTILIPGWYFCAEMSKTN
jgi:hypothetical protein